MGLGTCRSNRILQVFDMFELWGNAARAHKSYGEGSLLVPTAHGSNFHPVGMVDGDCAPCGYDSFQGDVG